MIKARAKKERCHNNNSNSDSKIRQGSATTAEVNTAGFRDYSNSKGGGKGKGGRVLYLSCSENIRVVDVGPNEGQLKPHVVFDRLLLGIEFIAS